MTKLSVDLTSQSQGLIELLNEETTALTKACRAEGQARLALEKHVSQMKDTHRRLVIEYSQREEYAQRVDPRTGKTNKEWTDLLIEEAVSQDPRLVGMVGSFYELQQETIMAQAALANISDRVGSVRVQCRLLAALLTSLAAEAEDE